MLAILGPMFARLAVLGTIDWKAFGLLLAHHAGTLLALLVLGLVVRGVLGSLIDRIVSRAEDGVLPDRLSKMTMGGRDGAPVPVGSTRRVQRARTMGSLLKSIVTGVVIAVIGTMMLSSVGIDIAPIIAGAGIIGVALGFGSQSLVKDFLSGMFMIFEDQYGVGDSVNLGTASGIVEAVGLRVTRIRDVNGTVWYVRNGEILAVGNMSQNWARTVLDIPVAFSENLARIRELLREVAHDLWEDPEYRGDILEEPEVWGVERWDPDAVVVRVVLKTAPLQQWSVAREMRERIKDRFDAEGVEIPFAQRVVWHRSGAPGDPEPAAAAANPHGSDGSGSGD